MVAIQRCAYTTQTAYSLAKQTVYDDAITVPIQWMTHASYRSDGHCTHAKNRSIFQSWRAFLFQFIGTSMRFQHVDYSLSGRGCKPIKFLCKMFCNIAITKSIYVSQSFECYIAWRIKKDMLVGRVYDFYNITFPYKNPSQTYIVTTRISVLVLQYVYVRTIRDSMQL